MGYSQTTQEVRVAHIANHNHCALPFYMTLFPHYFTRFFYALLLGAVLLTSPFTKASPIEADIFNTSGLQHQPETTSFYDSQTELVWFNNYGALNPMGAAWFALLADSELITPYYLPQINLLITNKEKHSLMMIDALLTDALIDYLPKTINQKTFTHINIKEETPEVFIQKREGGRDITTTDSLNFILYYQQNGGLEKLIGELTPTHPYYASLHEMLPVIEQLIKEDNWQEVPKKGPEEIKKGDHHDDIKIVRHNLMVLGDLDKNITAPADETLFDDALEAGLKKFQARHGIEPTGVIGKKTRKALVVSPLMRKKEIVLNMKRWRELPTDLGSPYMMVNIPDFSFNMIKDGQSLLTMNAVVGKSKNQTPLLTSRVNNIVVNPYWSVPEKIARKELLADIKKDPAYLTKNNFHVFVGWGGDEPVDASTIDWSKVSEHDFPYRLQQQPGDGNALGFIKFNFPNEHSVYMHDTSSRKFFSRPYRDLSHGCVRLQKPLELAEILLAGQKPWTKEKIESTIAGGKNTYVQLNNTVPIYFAYWTAWKDSTGTLQFRTDLYDLEGLSD
jgi:murein L,D-transpeptidase YcbB/YkuD